jgi:hypothetical protein
MSKMCCSNGPYFRSPLGLVLLAFILGQVSIFQVRAAIPTEELQFISHWTKLTVERLKNYEASTGWIRIIVLLALVCNVMFDFCTLS